MHMKMLLLASNLVHAYFVKISFPNLVMRNWYECPSCRIKICFRCPNKTSLAIVLGNTSGGRMHLESEWKLFIFNKDYPSKVNCTGVWKHCDIKLVELEAIGVNLHCDSALRADWSRFWKPELLDKPTSPTTPCSLTQSFTSTKPCSLNLLLAKG